MSDNDSDRELYECDEQSVLDVAFEDSVSGGEVADKLFRQIQQLQMDGC